MNGLRQVGNLLSHGSTGSTGRTLSDTHDAPLPTMNESLMARLFASLAAEFGPRWSSQFATEKAIRETKLAWWGQVHDLTPEEIIRGLDTMQVGQDAWPPGPRAFRRLCRANTEPQRSGAHVLYLGAPKATPAAREAALEHLGNLRTALPPRAPCEGAEAVSEALPNLPQRRAEFIRRHMAALVAAGLARFTGGAA